MSLVSALPSALAQGNLEASVALVNQAPIAEVNALALVVVTEPPRPRDLFEAHDPDFQEHPLRKQLREAPGPIREAIRKAANQRITESTPKPSASMSEIREQLALKDKAKDALAGLGGPKIDLAALKAEAESIVAAAKTAKPQNNFDPAALETFRSSFLGLNAGPDRIVEVDLQLVTGSFFRMKARDEIGFVVLDSQVTLRNFKPISVCLDMVRATHGRNADELELTEGAKAVIGRGNPQAVAAFFLGAMRLAQSAGIPALALEAGGPSVARLYERMGFVKAQGWVKDRDMVLDLTDQSKVETFLLGFYPSRWNQALENLDISSARDSAGDWLTLPSGLPAQK
jgi:hypothetical protein